LSQLPEYLALFRKRMQALQDRRELNDAEMARELGLNYMTYRSMMGRDPKRPGKEGPNLQTISTVAKKISSGEFHWLLSGQTSPTEGDQDAEGVLQLRRKDDPESAETRELLDLARKVLKSDDDLSKKALTESIRALSRPVKADNPIKRRARRRSA